MKANQNKELSLPPIDDQPLITPEGRQHLEKLFINLFYDKLSNDSVNTSKSILSKNEPKTTAANFIGLVIDCCLIENVNPLNIKNKKDAISLIRDTCKVIEIKNLLGSIKSPEKLKEVLRLSGVERSINLLWEHPERITALNKSTRKLEVLKMEVLDVFYWLSIVNELCNSGNKRLLAKFTTVVEVSRFQFETYFRKDKIFTTLIVSAVLGEIKNEFNFADIKRFEELVVKNPNWEKQIAASFEKLFVGSNFANIPFADIPYVQQGLHKIKKTFIPVTIGQLLALDATSKRKIIVLNNLKSRYFNTFVSSEYESDPNTPGTYLFDSLVTINKLVENESCLIFEEVFFVEPKLLMFLSKTQLKRLVFANRLHQMFDDDGLRKVFEAANLATDYEDAVLFADKALSPHVFSKILVEPQNKSILKDVLNYQQVKTFREMSKKANMPKGEKFSQTRVIILKLISLAGKNTKMNPKDYAKFLLSLAKNSKDVVDEHVMTALFMVYPEHRLPLYVVEFAKKQEWYQLFDENARKYFAL